MISKNIMGMALMVIAIALFMATKGLFLLIPCSALASLGLRFAVSSEFK